MSWTKSQSFQQSTICHIIHHIFYTCVQYFALYQKSCKHSKQNKDYFNISLTLFLRSTLSRAIMLVMTVYVTKVL